MDGPTTLCVCCTLNQSRAEKRLNHFKNPGRGKSDDALQHNHMCSDSSLSSGSAHQAHIAQTESGNVSLLLLELINVLTPLTHVHFLQGMNVCGAAVFCHWPEQAGGHRTSDLRVLLGLQKWSFKLSSLKIITVFELS